MKRISLLVSEPRKHGRVAQELDSQSSGDGVAASITPTTIKLATAVTPPSWVSPTDSYGDESVQETQGRNLRSPMDSYVDESVQETQGTEVPSTHYTGRPKYGQCKCG